MVHGYHINHSTLFSICCTSHNRTHTGQTHDVRDSIHDHNHVSQCPQCPPEASNVVGRVHLQSGYTREGANVISNGVYKGDVVEIEMWLDNHDKDKNEVVVV